MSSIVSFLLEVLITTMICVFSVVSFRPSLKKILLDLCGTEDRAQFWTVFTNMLLVGLPVVIALNYQPEASNAKELFFEISRKLSGNLVGFLFALAGAGVMIAFFALFAPRTLKAESK